MLQCLRCVVQVSAVADVAVFALCRAGVGVADRHKTVHVAMSALCRAVLPVTDRHMNVHVTMSALCRAGVGSG